MPMKLRRFLSSDRLHPRFLGSSIASIGIASLAAALLFCAGPGVAAPGYIDLRRIEPIQGDAAAGAKKATLCLACHGANGVSVAPTFPRLAGQRPDYLYHRLVSFKRAGPKDPYYAQNAMTANVASLSDADMRDLAVYFAAQTPQASDTASVSAPTVRGETLFRAGDPLRGIPPCQGCHGVGASGLPTRAAQYAAYPSLRGQYAPYVIARLTSFRNGLPHDSTNDFVMGGVAQTLDDDSIRAIAAWLSSLTPVKSL